MKHIIVPAPVRMVDVLGRPILDAKGEQVTMTFAEFLLTRLADAKIVASGVAGIMRAMAARQAVLDFQKKYEAVAAIAQAQADLASALGAAAPCHGYLSLEDDHFALIKDVVENSTIAADGSGGYNPAMVHNLVPFFRALESERVLDRLPAIGNGASAVEPTVVGDERSP